MGVISFRHARPGPPPVGLAKKFQSTDIHKDAIEHRPAVARRGLVAEQPFIDPKWLSL